MLRKECYFGGDANTTASIFERGRWELEAVGSVQQPNTASNIMVQVPET